MVRKAKKKDQWVDVFRAKNQADYFKAADILFEHGIQSTYSKYKDEIWLRVRGSDLDKVMRFINLDLHSGVFFFYAKPR